MKELRETELRALALCVVCKKKIGDAGLVFYRVNVTQYVVDFAAVRRQGGLAAMLGGNGALAAVMGPDEVMARAAQDVTVSVCANCLHEPVLVHALGDPKDEAEEPE